MLRTWLVVAFAIATVWLSLAAVFRQNNYGYRQLYRSTTTKQDDHSEIIDVVTELLGLLDALVAIDPATLLYPQADTGLHAPGIANTTAASIAGYSAQAIKLMCSLPYLQEYDFQVGHSTHMVDYTHLDEGNFEAGREMFVDGEEDLMPPSFVQITVGESIYGVWRIYDADKKVVYRWDMNEHGELYQVPPLSPREAFQPLLDDFRSLNWLFTRPQYGLYTEWPWEEFPQDWPEAHRKEYETDHNVWKAVRGLADIYLDCGWNAKAVHQSGFRRDEFVERRKRYLEVVVAPLEEVHRKAGEERRAKDAAGNDLWLRHGHSINSASRIF